MAPTPKPSPCFTPVNVFEGEGVKNGQKKRKLQMVLGSDGRDPPFIQLTSTDDTDGGSSASEVSVTRSPSRRGGAAVLANTRVCVACLCVCLPVLHPPFPQSISLFLRYCTEHTANTKSPERQLSTTRHEGRLPTVSLHSLSSESCLY